MTLRQYLKYYALFLLLLCAGCVSEAERNYCKKYGYDYAKSFSKDGAVYNKRGKKLSPYTNKGYYFIGLCNNNKERKL
jgi:hypothetical protein